MNALHNASSPYLLQHAHNPVHWLEWSPEAFETARKENKAILLSIGYSACHWCHVMAHESFENPAIAEVMNQNLVCIKLDREERPDIDTIYMDAVQAMGVRGGWPLNVFLLPNGKPFYGGTYFRPQQWAQLCSSIGQAFAENLEKITESAEEITQAINKKQTLQSLDAEEMNLRNIQEAFAKIKYSFDQIHGGFERAPKFPMPSVWKFTLRLGHFTKDPEPIDFALKTLEKMCLGGIFDHLGGGFARYSTDGFWKLPHFEKMLYDNAQLLSLLSEALSFAKGAQKALFERAIIKTLDWLQTEMLDASGGFYAALDADSEGQEGKYYVWHFEELEALTDEAFRAHYGIEPDGNFADEATGQKTGENILHASELGSYQEPFAAQEKALAELRKNRVRPGLDHKIIFSWNALTIKGLTDVFRATKNPKALELAQNSAQFLIKNCSFTLESDPKAAYVVHVSGQKVNGFLDDYATGILAMLGLYQCTFDHSYVETARQWALYALANFADDTDPLFFFTDIAAEELIARKKEIFDNVIPASNSLLAQAFLELGLATADGYWTERAHQMVQYMKSAVLQQVDWASQWAMVALEMAAPGKEVVLVGPNGPETIEKLRRGYQPHNRYFVSETPQDYGPFEHKTAGGPMIYICEQGLCSRPTEDLEAALAML